MTTGKVRRSRRSLYGMLAASGVSVLGTRITTVALPWFVLQETDSAALTGLVLTAEMAPYVVVKALGGPLVDRRGPRIISVAGDVLSGALLALIPILYAVGQLSLPDRMPLLLAIVALAGAVRGPGDGARNAMIPAVADATGMDVERVTGLDSTVDRAAALLGIGAGGFLVAGFGGPQTVSVTAAMAFASAVLVAIFIPRVVLGDPDEEGSYFAQLRTGFAFLRRDRLLRAIIAMITVTNLLEAAYIAVMLPNWVHDHGYSPALIGILGMLYGGAAVLTSLVATTMAGRFSRRTAYLLGFCLAGAPRYLTLAFDAPLWLIIVSNVVAGFGTGFINPTINSLFFERVPREIVGRVGSLGNALAWAGLPLGGIVGGAAVTVLGLAPALGLAGAAYLISTALPGARPEWREMDRARTPVDKVHSAGT
ncbi:MFS transporter [Knoellia remsis]|uniref:MFS transporter n=1 Tax=Knoellia remsis TaxID=407159 RepID=A0A2T0V0H2_9MICO|nr:MFS transporter [Knoellia remsis]PRY63656.1 MFS transporter [Knoellia remsis]